MALPVLLNVKHDLAFQVTKYCFRILFAWFWLWQVSYHMAILEHAPNTIECANAVDGLNMDLNWKWDCMELLDFSS